MREFLALAPSPGLLDDVREIQSRLSPALSGWRWLHPDAIHLTLRFLGDVDPERDREARETWRRAAASAETFRLRISGVGCFPPAGSPRVLWVGLEASDSGGILRSLQRNLEQAAREVGFAPERRSFHPHLTLARAARRGRARLPAERDFEGAAEMDVREVVLLRSHLEPSGARYTVLDSFPLGPGA